MKEADNANYWARMSRLLLFDLPTSQLSYVGLKRSPLDGDDIVHVDPQGDFVLLNLRIGAQQEAEIWRFPLDGSGAENAQRILDNEGDITRWWADSDGVIRLGRGRTRRGHLIVVYRSGPDEEFRRMAKVDWDDEDALDKWDAFGLQPGSDIGYTVSSEEDGRRVLREFDYSTGTLGKAVYANPDWDVESVTVDRSGRPASVTIRDDRQREVWLDR